MKVISKPKIAVETKDMHALKEVLLNADKDKDAPPPTDPRGVQDPVDGGVASVELQLRATTVAALDHNRPRPKHHQQRPEDSA